MPVRALVKSAEYRDSVALMLVARELSRLPGIADASAVMGTPANKAILRQAGLASVEVDAAGPNDLVVAVQAADEAGAAAALEKARFLLEEKAKPAARVGGPFGREPRSVRSAARQSPHANVAVISVPGQYAAAQAWDALRAGLSVLLFSDHVTLEDEIALKEYGRDHGLLVMGPGAGTALINGVGLGFANAVPRGPVGIVAAAGTGLQEVSALLATDAVGITQGIGVGGRDIKEAVGGIMMLEGLKALQADPETRVIVLVSKLPSPCVTEKIVSQVEQSSKPTVLALMASTREIPDSKLQIANHAALLASDLRDAAALAAALARGENANTARLRLVQEDRAIQVKARSLRRKLSKKQRYVRGLYSGGTLCEETMWLWQKLLGPVWSNAPLDPRFRLADSSESKGHTAIDLGDEEFTIGRPHPMIDNTWRVQRLLQEARDPSVAAIVLDVVLGYGAHRDPAAALAPAIVEASKSAANKGRNLFVIASVTGTERDPQGLHRQSEALRRAGAIVMRSNAAAARLAAALVC